MKLVVLLGNPGAEYAKTRHNIAWMLVEDLSFNSDLDWKEKFKGTYTQVRGHETTVLLKPQTYMNKSGESVLACAHFFRIQLENILIVHDDIELEYGQIDLKSGGGLAGHNGLRSIASALGSRDFYRFRLGVSRPTRGKAQSHVLGRFSEEERITLPTFLLKSAEALEKIIHAKTFASVEGYTKVKVI